MRDKDVINCLPGCTITTVPGQMLDEFVYIPCIWDAETSDVAEEKCYIRQWSGYALIPSRFV